MNDDGEILGVRWWMWAIAVGLAALLAFALYAAWKDETTCAEWKETDEIVCNSVTYGKGPFTTTTCHHARECVRRKTAD